MCTVPLWLLFPRPSYVISHFCLLRRAITTRYFCMHFIKQILTYTFSGVGPHRVSAVFAHSILLKFFLFVQDIIIKPRELLDNFKFVWFKHTAFPNYICKAFKHSRTFSLHEQIFFFDWRNSIYIVRTTRPGVWVMKPEIGPFWFGKFKTTFVEAAFRFKIKLNNLCETSFTFFNFTNLCTIVWNY